MKIIKPRSSMSKTIGGPEDLIQVYGDPHPEAVTQVVIETPDGDRGVYFAIGSLAGSNLLQRYAGLEEHEVVRAQTYIHPKSSNGVLRFLGFPVPEGSQERFQADLHTGALRKAS